MNDVDRDGPDHHSISPQQPITVETFEEYSHHRSYDHVNAWFTFGCFVSPPALGSTVSFLFNGGALWCLIEVFFRDSRFVPAPHSLAFTAVLWIYCLINLISAWANGIFVESLPQLLGLFTLAVFPFSYSIWSMSVKDEIIKACVLASAIACYGALFTTLFQYYVLLEQRVEGGAGNPYVFAVVTTVAFGIVLMGALRSRGWMAAFFIGSLFAGAVAVVFSLSRGVWPALLLTIPIVLWIWRERLDSRRARWAVVIALAGAAAFIFLFFDVIASRLAALSSNWSDIQTDGEYDSQLGLRLAMWEIGYQLWLEKPLLGHGAGAMDDLIAQRLQTDFGIAAGFSHFHNFAVDELVENGIFGLLALLAVLFVPLALAVRALSRRPSGNERFGATLIVLVLMIFTSSGMTGIMLGHDIMDAVFMMCLVPGFYLAFGRSTSEVDLEWRIAEAQRAAERNARS